MDEEARALERALRRRPFRFVALVDADGKRGREPPQGGLEVTLAMRCGIPADGARPFEVPYPNLMRRRMWAVPVYTLDGAAEVAPGAESIYDLATRTKFFDPPNGAYVRTQLEDGWGDTKFEQPGVARAPFRPDAADGAR